MMGSSWQSAIQASWNMQKPQLYTLSSAFLATAGHKKRAQQAGGRGSGRGVLCCGDRGFAPWSTCVRGAAGSRVATLWRPMWFCGVHYPICWRLVSCSTVRVCSFLGVRWALAGLRERERALWRLSLVNGRCATSFSPWFPKTVARSAPTASRSGSPDRGADPCEPCCTCGTGRNLPLKGSRRRRPFASCSHNRRSPRPTEVRP